MTDGIGDLPPEFEDTRSTLLLVPPSEAADGKACCDLLTPYDPQDENVLGVAISKTADEQFALWQQHVGGALPKRTTIVSADDAGGTETGTIPDESPVSIDFLSRPVRPSDLVSSISWHLGRWSETADPTFVCVHSLTVLLEELGLPAVVQLVEALDTRFASMGGGGMVHYHLDPTTIDEQTLADLRPRFDTVVEYLPNDEWIVSHGGTDGKPSRSGGVPNGGLDVDAVPEVACSLDTVFELLAAPERRAILYCLADGDGQSALDALVERILELEPAVGTDSWAASERDVTVTLVHNHLPKLEEAGVVDVDWSSDLVRYRPHPTLEVYLDDARQFELDE